MLPPRPSQTRRSSHPGRLWLVLAAALTAVVLALTAGPGPSSAVTVSHPARTTSASAAGSVRIVTYSGSGIWVHRASHELHRLRATGPGFRKAVTRHLNRIWRTWDDSKPACATAPAIMVKRWRSDGWAYIPDIGSFNPCPGGGNWAIWHRVSGSWRTTLAGQDYPMCRQLRRREVPRDMFRWCYRDTTSKPVRYTGP